jgi:hypothetical protein
MDRPRVARGIFGWACGPHQSIRPLVGAFAPGHHGYISASIPIAEVIRRKEAGIGSFAKAARLNGVDLSP